jgi:hypothetical protein
MKAIVHFLKPSLTVFSVILLLASCSQVRYTYYKKVKGEKVEHEYGSTAFKPTKADLPEGEPSSAPATRTPAPQIITAEERDGVEAKAESETKSSPARGFSRVTSSTKHSVVPEVVMPVRSDDRSLLITILLIILVIWLLGFLLWGNMIINLLLIVAFVILILLIIRHFA